MITKEKKTGLIVLGIYIFLRLIPDQALWRTLSPYYSYAFELALVFFAYFSFGTGISFKFPRLKESLPIWILGASAGAAVYRITIFSGTQIPFDFSGVETIFLLLVLAPVLEELIFRMALWEALKSFRWKPETVLVASTLLFSFGHFQAIAAVPAEFRAFVWIQTLYVILLGLGAGWARHATGSVTASILVHFGFNLGFFLASR